ncbi:MAG: hypothetical protein H7259_05820, partial [Cytophagales bacterium]|nr:hypothetical protein [Cytophaga sp.]
MHSPFKKISYTCILMFSFLFCSHAQQFNIVPNATDLGGGIYKLTSNVNDQLGYIWNKQVHDLTKPLTVEGQFLFSSGAHDGADGICFVMQDQCAAGSGISVGGGIGYSGMKGKSIAVEFDTYENINNGASNQDNHDPAFDHAAIVQMGIVDHGNPVNTVFPTPVLMNAANQDVEDGNWHDFKIIYTPGGAFQVYFDNV